MKNILLPLALLMGYLSANAQKKVTLNIRHFLGSAPLAFNKPLKNNLGHDFTISRVNYYISSISLIHDGGKVTMLKDKYLLVDGKADVKEDLGMQSVTSVEGIRFYIGVEAPTNNADPAKWPSTHPLAPKSPSMHWGWSAGYRFVALEGKAGPGLTTTYEMHGLGNRNYFVQTVMAAGTDGSAGIEVSLDADYLQAVKDINLASGPIDHGVDATDLSMLKNFQSVVFKPAAGTSILPEINAGTARLFPNPSNGFFHLNLEGYRGAVTATITDINGRRVWQLNLPPESKTDIHIGPKGIYLLQIKEISGHVSCEKIVVD